MNKNFIALILLSAFSSDIFAHGSAGGGHAHFSLMSGWLHIISSAHHGFAGLLVLAFLVFFVHAYRRLNQLKKAKIHRH